MSDLERSHEVRISILGQQMAEATATADDKIRALQSDLEAAEAEVERMTDLLQVGMEEVWLFGGMGLF